MLKASLDRLLFRVQPIAQLKKRQQRERDRMHREKMRKEKTTKGDSKFEIRSNSTR